MFLSAFEPSIIFDKTGFHEVQTCKKKRLPLEVYKQELIVFVTISTADRIKWFADYPTLANDAVTILSEICSERASSLFAWCIMPDHVHFLVGDESFRLFEHSKAGLAEILFLIRRFCDKN